MKFLKSKTGFTLIELLVVIGILAVLAAIAIPSVAGLIDRANVSADKTNANEMTNAIERFTSEYELYCQDIASGVIKADTTDFDAAQGRVYNVTQVKTRSEIETLEVAQGATVEETAIAIYRDTKYPVNANTLKAIVENYTKTSSTTFDPKQSDMHFWYSPACGMVVVATPESSVAEKNDMVLSGVDAKGNALDNNDDTLWIDVTLASSNNDGNSVSIDWTGIDKQTLANNSWENIHTVISAGKIRETEWKIGDSKSFEINGKTQNATLIGIDHDGANTATFMMVEAGGYPIKSLGRKNLTWGSQSGWEDAQMRTWLNTEAYESMSIKDYVIEVDKYTNNTGKGGDAISVTRDKLFLLSVVERGVQDDVINRIGYPYADDIMGEGKTYEYFKTERNLEGSIWTRTRNANLDGYFFLCDNDSNSAAYSAGRNPQDICPAFVIG